MRCLGTHGAESVGVKVSHACKDESRPTLNEQLLGPRNPGGRDCREGMKEAIRQCIRIIIVIISVFIIIFIVI